MGSGEELSVAEPIRGPEADPIEVVPVVVLSQVFPARPSSIPEIRNFVRRCLAESPLTEEGVKRVGEIVFRALLDAAGPTGSINVAFRIFPEHVEVDVLRSGSQLTELASQVQADGLARQRTGVAQPPRHPADSEEAGSAEAGSAEAGSAEAGSEEAERRAAALSPPGTVKLGQPGQPATFAEWMSVALRREGLTHEAAARQLGVSVKTVSRWVGGTTEPRMRDLRRIQEVFGTVPLP
jgi:hypothetical protein